jgi:ABC-type branched-subunit amino acid transport system ATPase component
MKTVEIIIDLIVFNKKKKFFFWLLTLILITAFFDALGVASILPFIHIIINQNSIETNQIISIFYQKLGVLGIDTPKKFIFFFGAASFILLMTSLILRVITNYFQIRFASLMEYEISKKIIQNYFNQPYIWFLDKNSADLLRNIIIEVNLITSGTLVPLINILTQGTVIVFLLILIISIQPILALTVGVILSLIYIFIFLFFKKIIDRVGYERLNSNKSRMKELTEAFGAFKEIKFTGLEKFYTKNFLKFQKTYVHNQSLFELISFLPRYIIEGVAFGGMIILVLILISTNNQLEKFIPIISFYAFAFYRLIPSSQQLYTSFSQIRYLATGRNSIYEELKNLKYFERVNDAVEPISLTKSIELTHVNFSYDNIKKTTLKNISCTFPAFFKIGILGATGSGKTTLVDIILGLLDIKQGTLKVDEKLIDQNNKIAWQKSIGYVPQQVYLSDANIRENIAFGIDPKNIDQHSIEECAKMANLHDFIINELPQGYDTFVGERGARISGGQKQRIGIARALYRNPQLIILDEATNSLDNETERSIINAIDNLKYKITIVIISHRLSTIKNCDLIYFLEDGEIKAHGNYQDLMQSCASFKKMLQSN